jgi:D-alanyl-D-alanine carboxypeptidase
MQLFVGLGLVMLAEDPAVRVRLQLALDLMREERHLPGVVLGVALDEGGSFALASGISDRARQVPMTADLLLLQGSVGKTYVAATALQLVHEGSLDLDTRIAEYVGKESWFARLPNGADITVRMLLNHTSGLVRYELQPAFTRELSAHPEREWRPAELLAYLPGDDPPFRAGQGWEYSDTNYIVLGLVIEQRTGTKLRDEIRRRLLEPLRLERTVPSDRRRIPGLSQGYAGEGNPFGGVDAMLVDGEMVIHPQFEWAGGGYASTAEDLARWIRALHTGPVVDRELLETARRGVDAPMLGRGTKYGLGVISIETPNGIAYGHSGFFTGYCAEAYWFPGLRATLALQINSSDLLAMGASPRSMLLRLAQRLAG